MKFLSLFSGIGGLDLGLEWAGWTCADMCETDPWCRALLAERFPGVPIHDDVTTLEPEPGAFDVVVGGFPCQDISSAGKGVGIEGERSGLWKEMHRVIDTVRPLWVIAENVPALRTRGADRVLGDLEGIGYTSRPIVVPASAVGAPHLRRRVFILARLADGDERRLHGQRRGHREDRDAQSGNHTDRCSTAQLADGGGERPQGNSKTRAATGPTRRSCGASLANTADDHRRRRVGSSQAIPRSKELGRVRPAGGDRTGFPPGPTDLAGWRMVLEVCPELAPAQAEPVVCRMADGLPERLGRRWRRLALKGLGNAVVPQVAQLIGETINRFEQAKRGGA